MKIGKSFLKNANRLTTFKFTSGHILDIGESFLSNSSSLQILDFSNLYHFIKYKEGMLSNIQRLNKIYVAKDLYSKYMSSSDWSKFKNIIEAK